MNKAILKGRLTNKPELKQTNSGKSVTTFTLAVPRRFQKDETDFIPCVAFEKSAEFMNVYFEKGQECAVCGRIQVRSWEDNEGHKRYATEIIVEDAYFCGSKGDKQTSQPTSQPASKPTEEQDFNAINEDEIPF